MPSPRQREVMHRYCEAFFKALLNWRAARDEEVLTNRLELVNTLSYIIEDYSNRESSYEFQVECESSKGGLLEEVLPSEPDYSEGADLRALNAARHILSDDIFGTAGYFVQSKVIFPLADFMEEGDTFTLKSITAVWEQVLRLPPSRGKAHFIVRAVNGKTGSPLSQFDTCAFVGLSAKDEELVRMLLAKHPRAAQSAKAAIISSSPPAAATASSSSSSRHVGPEKPQRAAKEAAPNGTAKGRAERDYVGARLAAYFEVLEGSKRVRRVFVGEVLRQRRGVFTVQWEGRGEPSDLDEKLLHKGLVLYEKFRGAASATQEDDDENWDVAHESVGLPVAAYFERGADQLPQLFKGRVTGFCAASRAGLEDQRYRVLYEDGDRQLYDQREFDAARALHVAQCETAWDETHESVGTQVAALFADPADKKGRRQKLFRGRVTGYKRDDEGALYFVVYEDGDFEEYDDEDLRNGKERLLELLAQEESGPAKKTARK